MEKLNQAVYQCDLILVYSPIFTLAKMLLVRFAPGSNNTNPRTSSIIVRNVKWHIPDKVGYWALSGPDVRYIEDEAETETEAETEDEDEDGEESDDDYSDNHPTLSQVLDSMVDADAKDEPNVIVNPHGRDVLKYYFGNVCPECSSFGSFCPGCGGVSSRYPDLFGGCGVDQSCPICLGYEFALEDKDSLRYIEHLESSRFERLPEAEFQEAKEEILTLTRERYELINARREEMGLRLMDLDKIQKDSEEYILNHRNK